MAGVERVDLKLAPQHCTIHELRGVWRLGDEAGFDGVRERAGAWGLTAEARSQAI